MIRSISRSYTPDQSRHIQESTSLEPKRSVHIQRPLNFRELGVCGQAISAAWTHESIPASGRRPSIAGVPSLWQFVWNSGVEPYHHGADLEDRINAATTFGLG
jgi:hypothetical protein